MKAFISGQKYFAGQVFDLAVASGIEIVGVCAPEADNYLGVRAMDKGLLWVKPADLNRVKLPDFDLGINAHGFAIINPEVINKARIGWLGYHPSLLPRHRGRSSIEWAIRFRDVITGGTLYWLDTGIDDGHIAYQDWCFVSGHLFGVDPKEAAAQLWREQLQPMGVRLFARAFIDLKQGIIKAERQDDKFITLEPGV